MFDGSVTSKPLIAAGKVKLLAVAYKTRMPEYPNVATMAELGYPDIDFSNWSGVFASGQTPAPLMEKIHAVLAKVNESRTVLDRYSSTGFEPIASKRSRAQMEAELRNEYERNAEIVKAYGIKLN